MEINKTYYNTEFYKLDIGEVFEANDNIYMKTAVVKVTSNCYADDVFNAINLENGVFKYFSDSDKILELDSTLTVTPF